MNDEFVDQCRREWSRLGVPKPLADEMAADLASDLHEAEAEGVSLEELLGRSAFDPESFAASWAAERGIIPPPAESGRTDRKPVALVAFTAVAALTVLVAALLLLTGEPRVSLVAVRASSHPPLVAPLPGPGPGPGAVLRARTAVSASAAAPIEWALLLVAILALGFAAWLWSGRNRPRAPRLAG